MYAKVNNGKIEKYPYHMADIQADNPNTSFALPLDATIMQMFNIAPVEETPAPVITYRQNVEEDQPKLVGGKWVQSWKVTAKSADEIKQTAKELRAFAYRQEADPLFFQWQRGKATQKDWMDKVNEIEARYPE